MTGNFRAIQETIAHTASPGSTIQLVDFSLLLLNTNIYVPPPLRGNECGGDAATPLRAAVCVERFLRRRLWFSQRCFMFVWMSLHYSPPHQLSLNHSIIAWEILWKLSHYLHFERRKKKKKRKRKSFHLPPINRSAGDAPSGSSSRCDPSALGLILENRQRKSWSGVSVVALFLFFLFISGAVLRNHFTMRGTAN